MEITIPQKEGFTVYTKKDCSFCEKIKVLLTTKNENFFLVDCDNYLKENKNNFLSFIYCIANKECKTFPIVFNNEKFIGGYTDTKLYFENIEKTKLDFDNECF
jgi:hypothetical protein